MRQKKKDARSTLSLLGIGRITEFSIHTRTGDLVFFCIRPTNLSVLPAEGVTERIYALLAVLKSMEEVELLALNASESFDGNKAFYHARLERETEPAVRRLLEQDRGLTLSITAEDYRLAPADESCYDLFCIARK